eukprot:SAG31_NODE_15760_length_740_cov_0.820593_1_plen_22_part_01
MGIISGFRLQRVVCRWRRSYDK